MRTFDRTLAILAAVLLSVSLGIICLPAVAEGLLSRDGGQATVTDNWHVDNAIVDDENDVSVDVDDSYAISASAGSDERPAVEAQNDSISTGNDVPISAEADTFVGSNGTLRVDGSKLVNELGDPVMLRGFSTMNGDVDGFDFLSYYNEKSLASVRETGANLLRLVFLPQHFVNDRSTIEQVYGVIDACVANDMYIIVDWHVIKDGDPNIYASEAIEFFSSIAERYGDVSNVLYEICNEPNNSDADYGRDWQQIKEYSAKVIPAIRSIDPNSLIICAMPHSCTAADMVVADPLGYDNIMYAFHGAAGGIEYVLEMLHVAVDAGLPIFATEFSALDPNDGDVLPVFLRDAYIDAFEAHEISWAYFELGDDVHVTEQAIVKEGMWDGTLRDEILTDAGRRVVGRIMELS